MTTTDRITELESALAESERARKWQAEHAEALEKNWERLVDKARAERDESVSALAAERKEKEAALARVVFLNGKLDDTHTHRCHKCEQTVTAETAERQALEAEVQHRFRLGEQDAQTIATLKAELARVTESISHATATKLQERVHALAAELEQARTQTEAQRRFKERHAERATKAESESAALRSQVEALSEDVRRWSEAHAELMIALERVRILNGSERAIDIIDAALAASPAPAAPASPTWPFVLAFAHAMEAKLEKNRHKGDRDGWLRDPPKALLRRLREETVELASAIENWEGLTDKAALSVFVGREAADVGNFAMMIADVVGALGGPAPAAPTEEKCKVCGGMHLTGATCYPPEDTAPAAPEAPTKEEMKQRISSWLSDQAEHALKTFHTPNALPYDATSTGAEEEYLETVQFAAPEAKTPPPCDCPSVCCLRHPRPVVAPEAKTPEPKGFPNRCENQAAGGSFCNLRKGHGGTHKFIDSAGAVCGEWPAEAKTPERCGAEGGGACDLSRGHNGEHRYGGPRRDDQPASPPPAREAAREQGRAALYRMTEAAAAVRDETLEEAAQAVEAVLRHAHGGHLIALGDAFSNGCYRRAAVEIRALKSQSQPATPPERSRT